MARAASSENSKGFDDLESMEALYASFHGRRECSLGRKEKKKRTALLYDNLSQHLKSR